MKFVTLTFLVALAISSVQGFEYQSLLSKVNKDKNDFELVDLTDYHYENDYSLNTSSIKELFSLHKYLVSTPSVSYEEGNVGEKLAKYLKSKSLTVDLQQVAPNRFNILAYKGTQNNTKVLVNSHIDTVPPFFPYFLEENGTKIFGRGSTDAKGSVSAQIIAYLEILDDLEEGEVSLFFDVGEESGADGIRYVEDNIDYNWDTVIFGEPTEGKLGVGHKGGYGAIVNVTGKASHSGYPELGINANDILVEFLYRLNQKEFPTDKLLGNSTLNIGKLSGGVAANVISPFASAFLFFRVSADPHFFERVVAETIKETNGGEHITFDKQASKVTEPIFFDYDIEGFENIVLGYGTDAIGLQKNKIPHKILYGPGSIHVAHGAGEYVGTQDLIEAVDGYKRLIKHSLSL